MHNQKFFYITTPIYYVTAKPHLGSLYSTVLADILARWHKLQGDAVFLLTGTDEHGQKIAQAAQQIGKEPKKFIDSLIPAYQEAWHAYHIDYTYFVRTTDHEHILGVQQWIRKLRDQGDIYKALYQGWYCTPCETFLTDNEVADQVREKVKEPLCSSCQRVTQYISEESYFFRLSAYQDRLLALYQEQPDFIMPKERLHEVIKFVRAGLKDLSISRTSVTWGIPFPDDPAHTVYVWADALNNYITAIGYGLPGKEQEFGQWWPANVQVMGKDIVRFHAVFWPAFLMASGLAMPKKLLVHGWIKVGDQKMSKSLGNVVDPMQLLATYGADAVRYYLARYMAINHDASFSIEDLEKSISSDLANDLGNLLHRVTVLALKYNLTTVQPVTILSSQSVDVRDKCYTMIDEYQNALEVGEFHQALAAVWKFINQVNSYFHGQEPWKLAQKEPELFAQIISVVCHSLHAIAIVLWPVLPKKMEELAHSLGVGIDVAQAPLKKLINHSWQTTYMLTVVPPLFEKPEPKIAISKDTPMQEVIETQNISIDTFAQIQLVVGTIMSCDTVAKSEKLYCLHVDFGALGKRQILSGVRAYIAVDALVGRQAVFVYNLAPRTMMGLESHGMLLAVQDEIGKLQLIAPGAHVPNGTRLK